VREGYGVGVWKPHGLWELDVVLGNLLEDEAALVGVCDEGYVGFGRCSGRCVEVQHHVVREAGGEDQWGAFDGQGDGGFQEAGDGVGVGRAQWGRDSLLDGGETDDQHGFGIVEGRWRVQAEVEGFGLREGDGGDVLVLRCVEAGSESDKIYYGADVCGVEASGGEVGVACRGDEVGAGAVGESGDDRLAVAVVQKQLSAGLSEAGELDVHGLLEAVGVWFEGEGTGEEVGVFLQGGWVAGWDAADGGEVFFDAGLLESSLGEVLRGTDKSSGTALYGGAEGRKITAGLGRHEEHGLLCFVGDGDESAFFADLFIPGFDADEPAIGRRVGGSAQEDADEQVVDGLAGG